MAHRGNHHDKRIMLKNSLAIVCLAAIVLALSSVTTAPANAGNGGDRTLPPQPEQSYALDGVVEGATTDGGGGGGGTGGGGTACKAPGGREIPCHDHGGSWDGYCYATVWSTDPDDPDPEKQYWWNIQKAAGNIGGVLTTCTMTADSCLTDPRIAWAPDPDPAPTTQELEDAARWLLEGLITAPEIGVWPGDLKNNDPDAKGAVGMPAWYWSRDPGPGIGQPDVKTTTVKGYTVRATATLVKTVWDTGDGHTVTCQLGSAPVNIHTVQHSPSHCDHVYTDRGDYTITATTHVQIHWAGAGQSGDIPVTVSRSGVYHVGEIQVVAKTVP
jgi:hypothetical protein